MTTVADYFPEEKEVSLREVLILAVRDSIIVGIGLFLLAFFFDTIGQVTLRAGIVETMTDVISGTLRILLPYALFITASVRLRALLRKNMPLVIVIALVLSVLIQSLLVGMSYANQTGSFGMQNTLQFEYADTADGVEITGIVAGGVADEAGLQVGDVILQIRRDDVDAAAITTAVAQADVGNILRFRLVRDGEEMAIPATITEEAAIDNAAIIRGYVLSVVVALIALFLPGAWVPYGLLLTFLTPLFIGYTWLIVATFSLRTEGLIPKNADGEIGGWTMSNWTFLLDGRIGQRNQFDIWLVTWNSFLIAIIMTAIVLLVASMAAYALSRMNFPGRRGFLGLTLILHSFPAVTLLIPIFIVLQNLGKIPIIGDVFGYNTLGGVALVMVAFELPLGVWLMKGFFDNVSWDMERSAMIDGASRWRTFFEIILPQIRPGLLALGVFSFLGGWNTYLIPATFMVGERTSNLPVLINSLTGEVQPVNWNQVAAVGLFQLIPILIFFIFAQEYLLNIYAGGTKGSN